VARGQPRSASTTVTAAPWKLAYGRQGPTWPLSRRWRSPLRGRPSTPLTWSLAQWPGFSPGDPAHGARSASPSSSPPPPPRSSPEATGRLGQVWRKQDYRRSRKAALHVRIDGETGRLLEVVPAHNPSDCAPETSDVGDRTGRPPEPRPGGAQRRDAGTSAPSRPLPYRWVGSQPTAGDRVRAGRTPDRGLRRHRTPDVGLPRPGGVYEYYELVTLKKVSKRPDLRQYVYQEPGYDYRNMAGDAMWNTYLTMLTFADSAGAGSTTTARLCA